MTLDRPLEHDLVLACTTYRLRSDGRERLRALVRSDICWERVLELAEQHRVLPLLYWALSDVADAHVPSSAMTALSDGFRRNALWSLRLASSLSDLTEAMAARGVRAIAWKGPALAISAYAHLGLRMYSDLDLLVAPADLEAAAATLSTCGLQAERSLPDLRVWPFSGGDGLFVELHWAPMPWRFAADFHADDLCCEEVAVGDRRVTHPAPADLLVMLCAHGSKHQWDRLQWMVDVAELLRARPDLDWARTLALANRSGVRRMVGLGLTLVRDVLDVPLPAAAAHVLGDDAATQRLAATLSRRLFSAVPGPPRGVERLRDFVLQLRLKERRRDQLRYAAGLPLGRLWRAGWARR